MDAKGELTIARPLRTYRIGTKKNFATIPLCGGICCDFTGAFRKPFWPQGKLNLETKPVAK
ncbi:MAG TPA: hypothetical protein VE344_10650 [Methylomirabilota bacterium]|nr:hypothetical protein [Methylomirabilota bacterium]